jgi:hypothetical protein
MYNLVSLQNAIFGAKFSKIITSVPVFGTEYHAMQQSGATTFTIQAAVPAAEAEVPPIVVAASPPIVVAAAPPPPPLPSSVAAVAEPVAEVPVEMSTGLCYQVIIGIYVYNSYIRISVTRLLSSVSTLSPLSTLSSSLIKRRRHPMRDQGKRG